MLRKWATAIIVPACLAATPAAAASKGGGREGGPESQAGMWASLPGQREIIVNPAQAAESLGRVNVTSTMWAGTGSAKCRVNFVVENYASAPVTLGFVGRTFDAKDEVVDAWVVTVAELPPMGRTGRLFSCSLGAVEFTLIPTAGFDWPPLKCLTASGESEPCAVSLKFNSTVPIVLNKPEKKPDAGKDGKKDEKKSKH